jgi:DNA-binding response OmpR family regulator
MPDKQTLMVVDGEPNVRSVIRTILERGNYHVIDFADVESALISIRKSAPALILTNVSLPGMTGHEAMQLFKQECPNVPVLMVSGLPDSAVIQHWVEQAGFDVFPKPFTARELLAKVRQVLTSSKTRNAAG